MSDPDSTVTYKIVKDFPAYRVGDDGSVWSRWARGCKPRLTRRWKQLDPAIGNHGYRYIAACGLSGKKIVLVHRAVLELFVGACPRRQQARHLDGNKLNNRLCNLAWGTQKENERDKRAHGRIRMGEKHPAAKLSESDVVLIRKQHSEGASLSDLAGRFGVHKSNIHIIIHRKSWKHI